MNSVIDPAAVAAREAREKPMNDRIAAQVRAAQEQLDAAGLKVCANWAHCPAEIPVAATKCPECGKNQGQSDSGQMSGVNRRGFTAVDASGGRR